MNEADCQPNYIASRRALRASAQDGRENRGRALRGLSLTGRCVKWLLGGLLCVPAIALATNDIATLDCEPGHVGTNRRFECRLDYYSPTTSHLGLTGYRDVKIKATFTKGATTRTTYAAWDGETVCIDTAHYVIRMSFPTGGAWNLSLQCESGPCAAVNSLSDAVDVLPSAPGNLVYSRGLPWAKHYSWNDVLTGQIRHWVGLVQGSPLAPTAFPWIGDAAWAAPSRASASDPDWLSYLDDRAERGFTVIHLGPAPYWAYPEGNNEARAFEIVASTGCEPVNEEEVEPERCSRPKLDYWRNLESMVQTINDRGMVAFVAGLMEPTGSRRMSDEDEPGDPDYPADIDHEDNYDEDRYPRKAHARTFARFLTARLAGNMVVLSPSFDSRPFQLAHNGETVEELMKAVGTEIAATAPHLPLTNHFGQNAGLTEMTRLQNEPWLDFQMLQSGAWLNKSEGAQLNEVLKTARTKPLPLLEQLPPLGALNGEAIYDEGEPLDSAGGRTYHRNAYRAREAMYLTWLNGSFGQVASA